MGLITKEVTIKPGVLHANRYIELGYNVPNFYDKKRKKIVYDRFAEIKVKVEDLPKSSHAKVLLKCDNCDREYETRAGRYYKYNHNGKTYCHNCTNKVFSSGENNWNWKQEKTNEERIKDRKYPEYRSFIKRTLARDNYTCQVCKKTNVYLEVHHLDGYDWCKEKRTDEQNAITLCKECHKCFHFLYGAGQNTRAQFEEWIASDLKLDKFTGKLQSCRHAYCIEDNEEIHNIQDYALNNNINPRRIYDCCNGKAMTYKNKHYIWLSEYEKMDKYDIDIYIKTRTSRKYRRIINIKTLEDFDDKHSVSQKYNISSDVVRNCCRSFPRLYEGQKFMYLDEYAHIMNLEYNYYD